ncbi:hypothetical protein JXB12_06375 [candidate division KSB1 bacterium]|nr:hypothetical protein [candidate division KSB1 bacterium]
MTKIDIAIKCFQMEDYDSALVICDEIIRLHPEEPLGYLGAASIYHGIMRNYWTNRYHAEFDSLITLAIDKGESKLAADDTNAENHFFYGAAKGIKGLQHMRHHEWLAAFREGLSGFNHIKKSYQLDDSIYDAYLGLGLFYYWKSVKTRILSFLRFVKDEREKGIEYIKIAVDKGQFSKLEGQMILLQIYYYEGMFDTALKECQRLEPHFANDPTWLYLRAKILVQLHEWSEARLCYHKLHRKLQASRFKPCYGFLSSCEFGLAHCEYQLGRYTEAEKWVSDALENAGKRDPHQETNGPLHSFDETLSQIRVLESELADRTR